MTARTAHEGARPAPPLSAAQCLPEDGLAGTLVGRVWNPAAGPHGGPCVVAVREDGVFDISSAAPTMSELLEADDPVALARATPGQRLCGVDELFAASQRSGDGAIRLLAPCDLQVIKAAGVTFAASLLERVIEEHSRGDATRAQTVREWVSAQLGGSLARIEPGSAKARELKELLIAQGLWSQYLEVGIGPDAEVFTKAPVLSAVGMGADIGIHPESAWNNPEPELVLAVDSRGRVRGATLGNDVNLRDFEGRSALLLGKAKDNNGSCAIGPLLRLFDDSFTLDDARALRVRLEVRGTDGFVLQDESSLAEISRDPLELVRQTAGEHHQYPDGFVLFLGSLFAPTQDRGAPGQGFTHHVGDLVRISSAALGTLSNVVNHSNRIAPWAFGLRALSHNLAERGLLGTSARSPSHD